MFQREAALHLDGRPIAAGTGGPMNEQVIVGLIILLAVGFILAKLVGGDPTLKNPGASEDD